MKGLLIKDLRLMKNMGNSLALILLMAVGMSFYIKDISFIVVYMAIIGTTLTSSTISYDEFDNGNAFLFSLPVSRKDYVLEKYLFSLLMCGVGWLLGSIIAIVAGAARHALVPAEGLMTAVALLPVAIGLNVVLIPLRLKFEAEKSRIAQIMVMGGFFLVCVLGAKLAERLGIDLNALGERMPAMSEGAGIAAVLAVSVVLLFISCHISIRIMERKEF
jgi:ABC-type transport system involved in multi-copper enzyme maturation permease subunit